MPARKVHLGAACLEARAVNEILRKFSQFLRSLLWALVIDFEVKYPDIRWTQCKSAQYLN